MSSFSPLAVATKAASTTSTTTAASTSHGNNDLQDHRGHDAASDSAPPAHASASPLPPPLHQAAQIGDVKRIEHLLSSSTTDSNGKAREVDAVVTANDRDSQAITALHWSAINDHVLASKLLLERGADVDAIGGDLQATPLHWAARNGHVNSVHLLLKHNADPTLLDSQSFNALHLAVHSSSAFLLTYMLFTLQPIAVDSADLEGHTGLHWACYQGDFISVELLLKAGASVTRPDNAGLTPLHWAAVKGSSSCISKLVEAGADIHARDKQGKTAQDMATELKSLTAFKRGLIEAGRDEQGRLVQGTLSPRMTNIVIFVLPTVGFCLMLNTMAVLPWWSAMLLTFGEFFGMHHVISRVLLDVKGPQHSDRLTKSPYLAAIIAASLFWAIYVWITRYLPSTPGYGVSNLMCGLFILLCAYNFFRACTLDPGWIPFAANDVELKEMIEDLVETSSFNGQMFCLNCLTRRPLRSKHSYVTKRCVARFDHYCPWVWNDVGVNNHRQFLLFVASLVIAVVIYIRLAIAYFSTRAPDLPSSGECGLFAPFCQAGNYDAFALGITVWVGLQLTWTIVLLGAQLWQIARQMTTLEVSNVGRYGYMGGKPHQQHARQMSVHASVDDEGEASLALGEDGATESSHVHGPSCKHKRDKGGVRKRAAGLLKILGIDRFTEGKAAQGLANSSQVTNPFDLGLFGNCRDFWSRGRELGVDYIRLYDVPDGGFRRVVAARKRREKASPRQQESRRGQVKAGPGYERLSMREDDNDSDRMSMDVV
ncbi:palmitoyltransferase akr1 [Microbotryomycetes sp. JL221]|nr:palmitoyltransferase akr1 [Microbotryomycetes sp. JL221]